MRRAAGHAQIQPAERRQKNIRGRRRQASQVPARGRTEGAVAAAVARGVPGINIVNRALARLPVPLRHVVVLAQRVARHESPRPDEGENNNARRHGVDRTFKNAQRRRREEVEHGIGRVAQDGHRDHHEQCGQLGPQFRKEHFDTPCCPAKGTDG